MLDFFLSYVLIYGQIILFFAALLASFGFPIPVTALLVASGALAAQGYLGFGSVFIYSFLGCILGDTLGFWFSRRYGKRFFTRIGLGKMFVSKKFSETETLFEDHHRSAIFYSRFLVTVMGPIVNVVAGLWNIAYKKFAPYMLTGELLYVGLFGMLGYVFSDQWSNIVDLSSQIGTTVLLIATLVVLVFVLFRSLFAAREES